MGIADGIDRLVRSLLQTNGHAAVPAARPSTAPDRAAPPAHVEAAHARPAASALPHEQESDEPDGLGDSPPAVTDGADDPEVADPAPPLSSEVEQRGEAGPEPLTTSEVEASSEDKEHAPVESGLVATEPAPTTGLAVPDSAQDAALAPTGGHDPRALERLETATTTVEALGLGYHLGGAVERIALGASAGRDGLQALREAAWLIERYIALVEQRPVGADLHASSLRLARTGEAIAELRALVAALPAPAAAAAAPAPVEQPVSSADEAVPSKEGQAASSTSPEAEPPAVVAPIVETASTTEPPGAEPTSSEPSPEPFGREVALMAIRWTIMVVAVIVVVLAVTLIGEWR